MQGGLAAIVGTFAASIWDITQNNGALTRALVTTFVHFAHSIGAM